jgi:hypothetical protein
MEKYMRQHTLMIVFLAVICGSCVACRPAATPKVAVPAVPKQDDADNPLVKDARPDMDSTLNDLLAGKYDNDDSYAPIARKVKGFKSWSIDSQQVVPDLPKAVRFGGTLKGPTSEATFAATMVLQNNGKWMIGSFEGPYPK